MQLTQALIKYFGYDSFRPGQEEIIQTILNHQDVLSVLPTGGGKSICYQLPALLLPGISLVISPLISLMKDQVDSLREQGIPALYLNSTLNSQEFFQAIQSIESGQVKLVYITPERLNQEAFLEFCHQISISQIAVDEAHCVSQWGHDFRKSYREISQFIHHLEERPVISAFTATATRLVQEDIIKQLDLNDAKLIVNSFDRPNIEFRIEEPVNKFDALLKEINQEDAMIIYANTRKNVDKLQQKLLKQGYNCQAYHAGMTHQEREAAQNAFIYEASNIIVATNAFGMGIDKPDVRKVIHYNLPTDLESYYQEAGRAGRDGLNAQAILLFNYQDIMTASYLISQSQDPTVEERFNQMIQYAKYTGCLRQYILRYFGENLETPCQNCSGCLEKQNLEEVTREGQMILSNIIRMGHAFGMTMVTDILKGKDQAKIRQWQFDKLSTYGLMKDYPEAKIKDIIGSLISHQYLRVNEYKGLEVTGKAMALLKNQAQLYVRKSNRKDKVKASLAKVGSGRNSESGRQSISSSGVINPEDLNERDHELYEALRELRYSFAGDEGVPAYIIFNNRSLLDMVDKKPINYEEFLDISGVGQVKADKYAEAFCDIIKEYR